MKNNRIIIWSSSIGDLFEGKAYGIAVQLYFWAKAFASNGWAVSTFSRHSSFNKEGIQFIRKGSWGKLELFHDWVSIIYYLITKRPSLVISRGADRVNYPLAILCRLFGVKFLFFGASDVNFEPGKELLVGGEHNRLLWQKSVKKIQYIIVQNQYQQDTLKTNYGKDSLILFNIWGDLPKHSFSAKATDVVWVANFRKLKRPEWIIKAASLLPEVDFTMVGGASQDKEYYEDIKRTASAIPNLHFLGPKSFLETNAIVSNAKVLCCTSTFEGFPNTFLQAWSYNIPVISTVDPSGVIVDNNLGTTVNTIDEFIASIQQIIKDSQGYQIKSKCVEEYFKHNHSADEVYKKMISYINS